MIIFLCLGTSERDGEEIGFETSVDEIFCLRILGKCIVWPPSFKVLSYSWMRMTRGGVMLHMVFSLLVIFILPFLLLDYQKLTQMGLVVLCL